MMPDPAFKSDLRFEAICCDIGDVLFYDFPIKLTYCHQLHAYIARHDLHAAPAMWEMWHCNGRRDGALMRINADLWVAADAHAWDVVQSRWDVLFQEIPGAIGALRKLSQFPIALVANQPKQVMEILDRSGHAKVAQHIILDSICGISKPDRGIYGLALQELGTAASNCVMIGDHVSNDVIPAKRLGMKCVWITPYPFDQGVAVPDVPEEWMRMYRDGRHDQTLHRIEQVSRLPLSERPDLCCASLSQLCEQIL